MTQIIYLLYQKVHIRERENSGVIRSDRNEKSDCDVTRKKKLVSGSIRIKEIITEGFKKKSKGGTSRCHSSLPLNKPGFLPFVENRKKEICFVCISTHWRSFILSSGLFL
ncbi:uncharacterized protein LOC127281583 [Leptopilina boulardi]|uniref:uncharacterized protein LOC127281583 n=1 Tax=Leptopilina boulardi TaxID=63433 RepID=UPI0021F5BA55|nr:uncharacterized protein LOC127281583 [Leptopilina boulardi]